MRCCPSCPTAGGAEIEITGERFFEPLTVLVRARDWSQAALFAQAE
jgi:hypothetical protein